MKKLTKLFILVFSVSVGLLNGCSNTYKCGNNICELSADYKETFETCANDCVNCEDENPCTTDNFDYELQSCRHDVKKNCCGNEVCEESESLYGCPLDCKSRIQLLEEGKEYEVKLNERFQFEKREIIISSIWDGSIVATVNLDTQSVGERIYKTWGKNILGVYIKLINVTYEIEPEKRSAFISVTNETQFLWS